MTRPVLGLNRAREIVQTNLLSKDTTLNRTLPATTAQLQLETPAQDVWCLTSLDIPNQNIRMINPKVRVLHRRNARLVQENTRGRPIHHIALILGIDRDPHRSRVVPLIVLELAHGSTVIRTSKAQLRRTGGDLPLLNAVRRREGALKAVLEPDGAAGAGGDDAGGAANGEVEGDLEVAEVLAVVGVGAGAEGDVVDVEDDSERVGGFVELHAELVAGAAAAGAVADGAGREDFDEGGLAGRDQGGGKGQGGQREGEEGLHCDEVLRFEAWISLGRLIC